jgi:hypothetical protein
MTSEQGRVLLVFTLDPLPLKRRYRNHAIRHDGIQDVHLTWLLEGRRVIVASVFLGEFLEMFVCC